MKAALPRREPERLARWKELDVYSRLREARKSAPKYLLHDGPPYANGHVHLGTALNKILKDFVLKSRAQAGFDVPYVPGWDCHGMPIEHQVLKAARADGESPDRDEIRRRCRSFAEEFVAVQREEFQRLGVFGRWDDPYLTLDPAYEAAIVEAFGRLHADGYIYKGLRSIHWCPACRTALANAEVEYDPEHRSRAVHVRFPVPSSEEAATLGLPPDASVMIWTTTPWTIPANVAIAVHPDLDYVLVGGDARHAIIAKALLPGVSEALGWKDAPIVATWPGHALAGLRTRHPLFDRPSPIVPGEHVTTEAGTGAVHTAPGHGEEDFELGQRLGLPTLVPVDEGGVFTDEAGAYAGRSVFDAGEAIEEDLRAAGALDAVETIVHSYPTCWRCHGPLIFLATEQWFLSVEHERLRERALEAVEETRWFPAWGRDRMRDSVASRPDWCLSRQRAWGVPIPAFSCESCKVPVLTPDIVRHVRDIVAEHGTDAWFARDASDLVPPGTTCAECGGDRLIKDPNILDVWFDASCSHLAVLKSGRWPELSWPADLYLEAVDQHRGWFQVSLLNSVAIEGAAPYRGVLTHGLVLDANGRKMSKSLGNVIRPEDVLEKHGADVLRLFFASVDATADFATGALDASADSYRKIRNTLRFLLGNLAGFEPGVHRIADADLEAIDRYALERLREVSATTRAAHDGLAFNRVYRTILLYLTSDVSAFYAHALKDRLYCDAPDSKARRSAQTVLFEIARECCHLLAPIACFTADEVWEELPAWDGKEESVHLAAWPPQEAPDPTRLAAWQNVLAARDEVLKAIEEAKGEGRLRDPAEAVIDLSATGEAFAALSERQDILSEVFVVARVRLHDAGAERPEDARDAERIGGWVRAARADATKCPRCWTWREPKGAHPTIADLCARCESVLDALGVDVEAP